MSIRQGRRLGAVGIGLNALILAGCGGPSPDTLVTSALDLVPPSVDYAIVIDDLAQVHAGLDIDAMAAEHPGLIGQLGRGLRSQFGFDPIDLPGLRASGVDPDQPAVIAMLSQPPGTVVVVLPGDGALMAERVTEVHRRRGALPTEAGRYRGIPISDASRTATSWVTLTGYLVTVSGVVRNDERVALARAILENAGPGALSAVPDFRALADSMSTPAHLLFYQAPVAEGARLPAIVPDAPALPSLLVGPGGGHDGLAVGLRLAPDSLEVEARCRVTGSPLSTMAATGDTRGIDFLARLPGDPFTHVATDVDPAAMWSWLRSDSGSDHPLAGVLSDLDGWARGRLGIDLATDVVPHLGPHFGIVANEFALQGTDITVHAELSNPVAFAATLDRVAERLRIEPLQVPFLGRVDVETDRIGSHAFHRIPFGPLGAVCFGVVDGHAIVTASRTGYAAVVGARGGVLENLPDARARAELETDPMVFVVVEPRVAMKGVRALAFLSYPPLEMAERLLAYLQPFDAAVVSLDADPGMVRGRAWAWANEPGVWTRLLNDLVRTLRSERSDG